MEIHILLIALLPLTFAQNKSLSNPGTSISRGFSDSDISGTNTSPFGSVDSGGPQHITKTDDTVGGEVSSFSHEESHILSNGGRNASLSVDVRFADFGELSMQQPLHEIQSAIKSETVVRTSSWNAQKHETTRDDRRGESSGGVRHFVLGLLAPWNTSFQDFSALTSASAVSIAIERLRSEPVFNQRINFSVVTLDTACESKTAAGNAVRMYAEYEVDAFIGPACSVSARAVGELAAWWNKPLISWVATDPQFEDKSVFSTMARTLGPFSKMGEFLAEFLAKYGWRRVAILSMDYLLWLDVSKAVRAVFLRNNITIAYHDLFSEDVTDLYFRRQLRIIQRNARIVFFVATKEDQRRFLLQAYDLGMTRGDYVFFTMEMLPEERLGKTATIFMGTDGRDLQVKQAYESVFTAVLVAKSEKEVDDFRKEVARRMRQPPWSEFVGQWIKMSNFEMGDKYSPFLHDAVLLYGIAVNDTINMGGNPRDGLTIAANMRGRNFQGMSGSVLLDANGDREPDYWLTDMRSDGTFVVIADVSTADGVRVYRQDLLPPHWPGGLVGDENAPPDTPMCGFQGELCEKESDTGWIVVVGVVFAIVLVASAIGITYFIYRRGQFERDLMMQGWRIFWEDIEPIKGGRVQGGSTPTIGSETGHSGKAGSRSLGHGSRTHASFSHGGSPAAMGSGSIGHSKSLSMPSVMTGGGQVFADIGQFQGVVVAIKHIRKDHLQLTRQVLMEFNELSTVATYQALKSSSDHSNKYAYAQIKEVTHENLNPFVGACIDPPNICLIWLYCQRGSLQDVLMDENIKLDTTFKMSFMYDIAKAMTFVHASKLNSHGSLKSSNCLVNSKWICQVTDYGMPSFLAGQSMAEESDADSFKRKLWTAPEILRENFPPPRGTQKGDVFSYAIIAYEIMCRTEPYNFDVVTPRDVVNRVRNGESTPLRPTMPESSEMGGPVMRLIRQCWAEDPASRPAFSTVRAQLRKLAGGEINIVDTVMSMMEKYAYNLEEIVEDRTQQLVEEKQKTDKLLYRMLPSMVADQLKVGQSVQPENYDQSTIYFSDIVGFTTLAADSNPLQIVDFLNDLYSCFDTIIEQHDVYKVETIGDAYMVVSGLPERNATRHLAEIANVALDLLSAVMSFTIRHRPRQQLQLRIGLHTGPVVAGVVGNTMPRYCLFGDTVNMASRMESTGQPLRIHLSKMTFIGLSEAKVYHMSLRGEMNIKGKGLQTTYWLHGRDGFDKPLPKFDEETDIKGGRVPVRTDSDDRPVDNTGRPAKTVIEPAKVPTMPSII